MREHRVEERPSDRLWYLCYMFDVSSLILTAGYSGLFAIIFAESGLFFGFFLPGDSLLFTAGFLASQGFLNIFILIPLLFVAAIVGDTVGYGFGKYVGPKIFTKEESLFFNPHHVIRAQEFFLRYGKRAIFFCRFIPIVRTFVPIVAGVAEMPYRSFLTYNILGGAAWAGGIKLLGYFLGASIPQAEKYLYPIIILIILISFIPVLPHFLPNRRKKELR